MTNEEKMTPEEAIAEISFLKVAVNKVMEQALEMAIQALSQEPTVTSTDEPMTMVYPTIVCDDAISRQAVKELIKSGVSTDTYDDVEQVCKWIDALPSVTQKSGKWIKDECGNVICSECKRFRRDCRYGHTNYCNHCGAKMESEDKE